MTETQSPQRTVSIAPDVVTLVVGHAVSHGTTTVHGALIGKATGTKVEVTGAFPICHETPTKVLVETSLSLVQSTLDGGQITPLSIVGWYTAPELVISASADSAKASPVALRVVAGLASADSPDPILLVLDNDTIVKIRKGEEQTAEKIVSAFGKDFGNQWMEPLKHEVPDFGKASKAIASNAIEVKDLTDHWKAGASSEWTTSIKS